MTNGTVDLFLGSDLGLWALAQTEGRGVSRIITLDEKIAAAAERLLLPVLLGNANDLAYTPAAIGLSVHYPRIFKPALLARYRVVYNLHPGLLPWGKGYYPVFWAMWDGTPAGSTLHIVNAGIDEGDIVDQTEVEYGADDTGATLVSRVRKTEKGLFLRHWPAIRSGSQLPSRPHGPGGSYHSKKDFFELKACKDWRSWSGEQLMKLIRCLTVAQYSGWELTFETTRFEVKLNRLDEPTIIG